MVVVVTGGYRSSLDKGERELNSTGSTHNSGNQDTRVNFKRSCGGLDPIQSIKPVCLYSVDRSKIRLVNSDLLGDHQHQSPSTQLTPASIHILLYVRLDPTSRQPPFSSLLSKASNIRIVIQFLPARSHDPLPSNFPQHQGTPVTDQQLSVSRSGDYLQERTGRQYKLQRRQSYRSSRSTSMTILSKPRSNSAGQSAATAQHGMARDGTKQSI